MITKYLISDLQSKLPQFDLLLTCASFEERSVSIAEAIHPPTVSHVIIFQNRELETDYRTIKHRERMEAAFGSNVESCLLSNLDPIFSNEQLVSRLGSHLREGSGKLLIDITTFTHEQLLMVLKLISSSPLDKKNITFVYTAASQYGSWLTRGVKEIRSVLGYPGLLYPSRDLHLVILMGFEVERAARLIQEFEPNLVSIGTATESQSINSVMSALNKSFTDQLLTVFPDRGLFNFSAIDPTSTLKTILSLADEKKKHNMVVAPMNTKLSTLGAGLAAIQNHDIQICYAPALLYNSVEYSSPANYCFIFNIDDLVKS
jgi:hypothetical protein